MRRRFVISLLAGALFAGAFAGSAVAQHDGPGDCSQEVAQQQGADSGQGTAAEFAACSPGA